MDRKTFLKSAGTIVLGSMALVALAAAAPAMAQKSQAPEVAVPAMVQKSQAPEATVLSAAGTNVGSDAGTDMGQSIVTVAGAAADKNSGKTSGKTAAPKIKSHWNGIKVAYLGDSITEPNQVENNNLTYWCHLRDLMDIEPLVYAISGLTMLDMKAQAEKLEAERGQDVDAIFVFAGTNDYNNNVPIGQWYDYSMDIVNHNDVMVSRVRRDLCYDDKTFCGRTNIVLRHLKERYPTKQIILLTPLHRGFSEFGAGNVQPDEHYANACGSFIDEYAAAVKEAGTVWAVPVIDLYSLSGLYPLDDGQAKYFNDKDHDRLHPNTSGHLRMALTIAYQLQTLPASF